MHLHRGIFMLKIGGIHSERTVGRFDFDDGYTRSRIDGFKAMRSNKMELDMGIEPILVPVSIVCSDIDFLLHHRDVGKNALRVAQKHNTVHLSTQKWVLF